MLVQDCCVACQFKIAELTDGSGALGWLKIQVCCVHCQFEIVGLTDGSRLLGSPTGRYCRVDCRFMIVGLTFRSKLMGWLSVHDRRVDCWLDIVGWTAKLVLQSHPCLSLYSTWCFPSVKRDTPVTTQVPVKTRSEFVAVVMQVQERKNHCTVVGFIKNPWDSRCLRWPYGEHRIAARCFASIGPITIIFEFSFQVNYILDQSRSWIIPIGVFQSIYNSYRPWR